MKYTVITLLILIVVYALYKTYQRTHIAKGLDSLIAEGAVILDVRTPSEYEDGHIASSVNIPLSKLRKAFVSLDTGKTYITCCSHGLRSVKAVEILKERGFRKVYNGGPWTELDQYIRPVQKP
jgi:rhodanese-related sulfurtransferase